MLEVLKQLQIKPRAPGMQANICNQKMPGDCGFLGSFTSWQQVGILSYRQTGNRSAAAFFRVRWNAPAFSAKTLQSLEVAGLYWRNIQPISWTRGNSGRLRELGQKRPEVPETAALA
ncbi:MAG: hypothetical protein V4593_02155 [Pseudomonadota bacterium]